MRGDYRFRRRKRMSENGDIVVTGERRILGAQAISRRSALRLEAAGLPRGRGRSMLAVVNQQMGTAFRTAEAAYPAYDAWIGEHFGIASHPLGDLTRGRKRD